MKRAPRTTLRPYLVRSGFAFVVAKITEREVGAAPAEEEPAQRTHLSLTVVETWAGPTGGSTIRILLDEPVSPIARLRSPHPYWGSTPTEPGTVVLLWFELPGGAAGDVVDLTGRSFGVTAYDADDPELVAVRAVLADETGSSGSGPGPDRASRYLAYLGATEPVVRMFGIDALGNDDLGPDADARVATSFAQLVAREPDARLRVLAASLAAGQPYRATTAVGRAALLGALMSGTGDADEDYRTACLDALAEVEPFDIEEAPPIRSKPASEAIAERAFEETDAHAKRRFEDLARKVSP